MATPTRRHLLWAAVGLIVVLAAVITIGAVTSGEAPPMTASVAHQYRSEEASDLVPVEIRNHGDERVMVSRMELVSPSIIIKPAPEVPFRVKAGNSRRIRLAHEGSKCPDAGTPAPDAASLRLTLTDGRKLGLALPDPERLLARLTEDDCALDRVFKVVEIRFGESWRQVSTPDGPVLHGSVLLARRTGGGPAVTVTGPRGSTLVDLGPRRGEEVAMLRSDAQRLEVPLVAEAARCDAHGMVESKKAFQFPTWVELGDERERYFELRAGAGLEKHMRRLVADTCRDGG